jgi:hypothetical protein
MENTEVALFLIEHPVMILPYVLEKLVTRFGYLKLISGSFIAKYGPQHTRIILQGTKTKLILNCADPQTAETMAKIIGKQEFRYTAENHSRSRRSGSSGNSRTDSFNEQLRESYAVMPDELANLRDLYGYLKIAQDCAPVKLKPKKFAARARRFVSLPNSSTDHNIQDQWRDLED